MEHGHMEAPNSKYQIPNKFQSPKSKTKSFWPFEIGIWRLFGFGICDLGFLETMPFARSHI